jgi:hypothetical protein
MNFFAHAGPQVFFKIEFEKFAEMEEKRVILQAASEEYKRP